jgi:hypothetical protein
MSRYVGLWLGLLTRCLQSHGNLLVENLALRQQLAVLKRKHSRPGWDRLTKSFGVLARRFWGAWKQSLVLVNPESRPLASCWFSLVLEFDLQGETANGKEDGD